VKDLKDHWYWRAPKKLVLAHRAVTDAYRVYRSLLHYCEYDYFLFSEERDHAIEASTATLS